jgi:hypothetical protein
MSTLASLKSKFQAEMQVLGFDASGQEQWVSRFYVAAGHKLVCYTDMTKKRACPELDLNVAMVWTVHLLCSPQDRNTGQHQVTPRAQW